MRDEARGSTGCRPGLIVTAELDCTMKVGDPGTSIAVDAAQRQFVDRVVKDLSDLRDHPAASRLMRGISGRRVLIVPAPRLACGAGMPQTWVAPGRDGYDAIIHHEPALFPPAPDGQPPRSAAPLMDALGLAMQAMLGTEAAA